MTEKYLEYLAVMQLLDLDLASEYLVMAATLAHIKSKMLLPAPPPGQEDDAVAEEEEDPREGLIRRLLEYQKYKQAAADLAAMGVTGRDVFFRGTKIEEAVQTGLPPLAQVPLFSLVEAFQGVLAKSKIKLSHDIVHERMTLTDRINELVDLLRVRKRVVFEELFEGLVSRFDLVITFLALLEMTKLRMTRLFQEDPTAPIHVEFTATSTFEEATEEPGHDASGASDARAGEEASRDEAGGDDAHLAAGGDLAATESDDDFALEDATTEVDTDLAEGEDLAGMESDDDFAPEDEASGVLADLAEGEDVATTGNDGDGRVPEEATVVVDDVDAEDVDAETVMATDVASQTSEPNVEDET